MDPGRCPAASRERRVHRCRHQLDGIGGGSAADPSCRGGGACAASGRSAGGNRPGNPPAGPRDLRVLTRINGRLRTKPQFPGPVELAGFAKTLAQHGMRPVEDARERYRFAFAREPMPS